MGSKTASTAELRMRDLFFEDGTDMGQGTETLGSAVAAQDIRDAVAGSYVCPFCGSLKERNEGPCPRCTMDNSPATRQATKVRIGPWYVLQTRNPAAPGMKFETLLTFVRKGRIKPRSIVRGPTTHQLWRFAAHVKGLSREFGVCYSCGGQIEKTANICSTCNRLQEPPVNPDVLLEAGDAASIRVPAGQPAVYKDLPAPEPDHEPVAPQSNGFSPAPRASNGATTTPTPAGGGKKPDGFLSARDLAAAFKLGVTNNVEAPANGSRGGDRRPPGGSPPRMKAKQKRQRGRFKYVLLLLFLAACGTFAYLCYRDPVLRDRSLGYYRQGLAWVKQEVAVIKQNAARKNGTPTAKPQAAEQSEQPVQQPAPFPVTQPAPLVRQPDEQKERHPLFEESPAPPDENKVEEKKAPEPAAEPIVDDLTKSRTLYRGAIDDEARGDYASAAKKYEQIKKLPHDVWPRDLDLRLKEARQQVQ